MLKEFVLTGPKKIEFRDYHEPELKETEVRIKTIMSGISQGTEVSEYRGTMPYRFKDYDETYTLFVKKTEESKPYYPLYLGYENVGIISEVGKKVNNYRKGEIVSAFLPHRPTNVVEAVNPGYWKGLLKLGGKIKPEEGIFINLAVVALVAAHDGRIKLGDRIAIFGAGCIGLILTQMVKLSGAEAVFVVDLDEKRLELAKELGADYIFNPEKVEDVSLEIKKKTARIGADTALDCSGTYKGLNEALRCVVKGGRVVNVGTQQGGGSDLHFSEEFHHNRLEIIQTEPVWYNLHRNHPHWNWLRAKETVVELINKKRIKLQEMLTNIYDFEKAIEVYKKLDEKKENIIKSAFKY